MTRTFIGAPWDDQDGLDMHGREVQPTRSEKRPKNFLDTLRDVQLEDGFVRDTARSRNAPTYAEAEMADAELETLIDNVDAQIGHVQQLEDFQDPEFSTPFNGLTPSQKTDLRNKGQAVIRGFDASDHRQLRAAKNAEQNQQARITDAARAGEELADNMHQRFAMAAPDLAGVDQRIVEDYARRVFADGGYSAADFTSQEDIDDYVVSVAKELRENGFSRADADEPKNESMASTMNNLRTRSGF